MITAFLALAMFLLFCYVRHLHRRIAEVQMDMFKYSTHDYVVQRFTSVWSEIHHTQDAVSKLQSKRGNR